jgi:hypothetical protein
VKETWALAEPVAHTNNANAANDATRLAERTYPM